MSKQLYVVIIETEVLVLADSAAEAEEVARDNDSDILDPYDMNIHASPMSFMPSGWDDDSLPFGGDEEETVGSLIAAGAAPKYTEMNERLAKRKEGA